MLAAYENYYSLKMTKRWVIPPPPIDTGARKAAGAGDTAGSPPPHADKPSLVTFEMIAFFSK